MPTASTVLIAQLVLAAICLWAIVSDLRLRRLPNVLALTALASGLGFAFALHPAAVGLSHLWHALIALVAGLALFAVKWIGGGDAKFYAGVASWFPLKLAIPLIGFIALAAIGLFVAFFGIRRIQGKRVFARGAGDGTALPFGVAIGAAAALLFPLT